LDSSRECERERMKPRIKNGGITGGELNSMRELMTGKKFLGPP